MASTTKKAAAPRKPRKTATQKRTEAEAQKARQAELEARVQAEYQEKVEAATDALEDLENSVTQREWLLITLRLDRTREQIAKDGSLRLLALGWVREKRDHGGAD